MHNSACFFHLEKIKNQNVYPSKLKKIIKRAAVSFSNMCSSRIFVRWATSKTLTRTPNNLDPEKPGPSKIWTLKNMDSEKHGINMGLKNISDFRVMF